MAMIPEKGMEVGYSTEICSLRVKIISYENFGSKPVAMVKVLRKLNDDPRCHYKVGEEFPLEGKELESLVLDVA